jgi:hypothetical protein
MEELDLQLGVRSAFDSAWDMLTAATTENGREFTVSVYEETGYLLETFRRSQGHGK